MHETYDCRYHFRFLATVFEPLDHPLFKRYPQVLLIRYIYNFHTYGQLDHTLESSSLNHNGEIIGTWLRYLNEFVSTVNDNF